MVGKAKTQLLNILSTSGFPIESLAPVKIQNTGPDTNLDVLTTLLAYGKILLNILIFQFTFLAALYPNVLRIEDKRRVRTIDNRQALMNKFSVNCPIPGAEKLVFPSSLFIFGEKV